MVPPKQSRSFQPWIFGFTADVDAWLGLLYDLLRRGLTLCVYFSSPVTIRCKKSFLYCRWSSCLHVTRCRSTSLSFNSYGTQGLYFWIIPNVFKCFKLISCSTPNDSASSACAWHESSWSNTFIFKLFWCARAFFIFNIEIIIFKESEPISACCFRQSMVAASHNKNSVRFSHRFLLNKVVL